MHPSLLQNISQPRDLKRLNSAQIQQLCGEIRQFLLDSVSKTGGHLASNLGAVELTVALHRVFETPQDAFVFDVGHQCYTHKLLTGRYKRFGTLRQLDGLSGFPNPNESAHDAFIAGHGNTALSVAIGIAWAKKLKGEPGHVVAIIGDGALTGGFTDCMLQNGAVKVYAVDVGYGQLAWSLRTDERVVNMERTNIRNVTLDMLAEPIEFFSVDVSFISLHHIFPVAQAITTPDAMGVCLVKPQFEAGREKVGKNGVVRDPATHREVLHNAMGYAAANGFVVRGLDFSPVKGPEGNIEYLMFVQKSEQPGVLDDSVAEQVVAASHSSLDK